MLPMRRRTPSTPGDYLEILRRRAAWVLVPAVLIAGGTAFFARRLPKIYKSESLILVEPQKVPADFVRPTVTSDVADRLEEISEEILSRTRLLEIINKFGLYQEQRAQHISDEQLVTLMRSDIQVQTTAGSVGGGGGVGAFRISYQGRDPVLVQQVTAQLASLFIEENLKVRQSEAMGTKDFIDSALAQANQTLNQESAQLQAIKARNMGSLPEQEQANLQQLSQMQQTLQNDGDAIARDQQDKTIVQSMLTSMASSTLSPATSPLAARIEQDKVRLAILLKQDKPTHPAVIQLKNEIAALEAQLTPQKGTIGAAAGTSARDQVRRQIDALNNDIALRTQEMAQTKKRIKAMEARLEREPAVEAQLASVQRNYNIAQQNYESLLQKKDAAGMAAAMESQAEGEEFRVIDPANLPQKPDKPNLPQLYLMGCVLGLLGGGVLGLGREYADGSIRGERDLAYYLPGVPLLAAMPALVTRAAVVQQKKRRKVWLLASAAVVLAGALGAGLYFHLHGGLGLTQWF